jgi:ArsR family transcriptional regulator
MASDQILEALASRLRREILAYFSAQELSSSKIASRFKMSAPPISRHLSRLEAAGQVVSERFGQFIVYQLCKDNPGNTLAGFSFEIRPKAGLLKRESRTLKKLESYT